MSSRRTRRILPRLLTGTALAGTVVAAGLAPVATSAELPISGDGSARDPYQIATSDDLLTVANAINDDPGAYSSANYALTADIDFGGAEFPGIGTFSGTIEGAGHSISDIVYGEHDGARGLIHRLEGGAVRNLTIEQPVADNGSSSGYVAGIAVYGVNATLTGNSVIDAEFTAASAEKVGGMLAELDGGNVVDNWVTGTLIANEMPGGVAAYVKGSATLANNLVDVDLTMLTGGGPDGNQGNDAGHIVAYPGTPNASSFQGNVAFGGSIDYEGRIDGFVGRIVGYTAYDGWSAENNLANQQITISGEPVTGPGTKNQHGTDVTAEQLGEQQTYEDLGWDFVNAWTWDDELGHPVPNYSYSLFGAGTQENPYEIATEDDLEFLAAQLNADNSRYTGDRFYVLTTDLDFSDRDPFTGFDVFEGELDGAGHTISGLTYGPSEGDARLGLVRELTGGAIRHVTLDSTTADGADRADLVAGVAVIARDSIIEGVSVVNGSLTATAAEKVAGLVAEAHGESVIRTNRVDGSISADKMPAGVVSYATGTTEVTENLVAADLTTGQTGGTRGVNAAMIVAYPGNGNDITVESNVALSGNIDYTGTIPNFAGRILGYVESGLYEVDSLRNNLAAESILIAGEPVTGTHEDANGADTTAEALGQQATYEEIGWNFGASWDFDEQLGHPVPRYITDDQTPNRITATFHGDTRTQRAFTWYSTVTDGEPVVRLSTDREFPEGESTVDVAAEQKTGPSGDTYFQAVATELAPGNTYYYRVGDRAEQVWSVTGTFETSDGEDDFTFVNLTDTQSQNLDEAELSAATMAKSLEHVPDAEFMLHSGDVVENGGREQDWADLLDASRPSLTSTTIAPASGNHDAQDDAFVSHFALEAPNEQDTSTGAYYSFDYNDAHISVLNTNEDPDQAVTDEQLEWLRADVEQARANGAKWIMLSMHKGVYTTANHLDDADIMAMREVLVPLIDELDIDLVFQGHDHVMSRSKVLVSDPNGVEHAKPVETTVITEMNNGKRAEYAVDPEGTIFFLPNTAGAKHYAQETDPGGGIDIEAYLDLFDRTGARETENFTAVRVTDDRLTVDVYDIRDQGVPRLFESFGIDRQLSPVVATIDTLPAVDQVTVDDADAIAAAREAVDALTSAQRSAVTNLGDLEAVETRLRELQGLVSTDGRTIAWAEPDASSRQPITVHNDTGQGFTDAPVQVTLESTPDVPADQLAVFGADAAPLPYEVETWTPGGTSVLWIRVPEVAAESAATVWAYYGGDDGGNDPTQVWAEDYSLVEHFASSSAAGDTRVDSTGAATGTVVGGALDAVTTDRGTAGAAFGEARVQYPGDIGGDYDRFTVSSVYTLTESELASMDGFGPLVAKEPSGFDGRTTFSQGIAASENELGNRLLGNSFEFSPFDVSSRSELPEVGQPHLVTQTYDGMTYSVFVDGEEVHSQFLEYRSTYSDPSVPTTIGDYATGDDTLASPFPGVIDEVQIAGTEFTPEFEAFRYDTMFGDAVSVGETVDRRSDPIALILGTPTSGTEIEAGVVDVTGTISETAVISASVGGETVENTVVNAGEFTLQVPVNETGEQVVSLQAKRGRDTATAEVTVTVADTTAPEQPEVADNADSGGPDVRLTATPRTDDLEQVNAEFFANELIALSAENTTVRTGTTTDRVPDALTPTSGEVSDDLHPSTTGDDANPYQIYEITLTDEQVAEGEYHVVWNGTADDRTVSAWVYDHAEGSWRLKDSGSDADGDEVELDITARAEENAVDGTTMHVLVWRGLTSMPTGEDHDFTVLPEAGTYDWAMNHVPDTQLYAQATPRHMTDMFQYIAEVAEQRKTELIVHAGDLVNRPYLSQEYQFKNTQPGVRAWEEAGIPYLVSWGNHDYKDYDGRNERQFLPEYFPMERMESQLEDTPWEFGGSHEIDNYYYTAEIEGAKVLVLTVGFFSIDDGDEPAIDWARDVIESHPDHSVILAMHNAVNQDVNQWSQEHVMNNLITPYSNVKLVLGGHITGTGVARTETVDGTPVYGVLTDYQGRVYGGQQFLKHISVDAENDLMYFNTYSPWLDETSTDGPWHHDVPEGAVEGLHGHDTENFVLEIDLGGTTTRMLDTGSLTLAAGAPELVGDTVSTTGDEPVSVVLEGPEPGTPYEWYAELTDEAGHVTRSEVAGFTVETSTG